jgi:alanine racemase
MAVVKANAYGHGMIQVARTCLEAGASYLGVATLDEALTLRENGIGAPILVLGYIPDGSAPLLVNNDIEAAVFSYHFARAVSQAAVALNRQAALHVKIDTGMNRIGLLPDQAALGLIQSIKALPGVSVRGIFTHFATADALDKSFAREQMLLYKQFLAGLERANINIPLQHIANSAAIMDIPEVPGNMARAGITTYGLYPSDEVNRDNLAIIPHLRLKSRIAYLKTVRRGHSVGYGRTYTSSRSTTIATFPIGYADGYSRLLSNRSWAMVNHQKVEQIGTICMDQCMFDVSEVKDIREGDEIILLGRPEDGVTADDLAGIIGTINYEIVCAISDRVPRVYIN